MLVSKQFDEFMRMVGQGRITPERLQIFMDHPDGRIIDGDAEERMLIERLPDNSIADSLKWFDGKLCYNVMVGEKSYRLRCPEGWVSPPLAQIHVVGRDKRGELVYVGRTPDGMWRSVNTKAPSTLQMNVMKDVADIWSVSYVNDKVLACLKREEGSSYVMYGDKMFVPYRTVRDPRISEGKIVYAAEKGGEWFVCVDGELVGDPKDGIWEPQLDRGQIVYAARTRGNGMAVFRGKEMIGREFDECYDLQVVNGKVLFRARSASCLLVVFEGEEYRTGEEYSSTREASPQLVDRRLLYKIRQANGNACMVWGRTPYDTHHYDDITAYGVVDAKVWCIGKKDGRSAFAYDQVEYGGYFDQVIHSDIYNGFLTIIARCEKNIWRFRYKLS